MEDNRHLVCACTCLWLRVFFAVLSHLASQVGCGNEIAALEGAADKQTENKSIREVAEQEGERERGERRDGKQSGWGKKLPLVFVLILDLNRHFEDTVTDYSVWSVQSHFGGSRR